MMSLLLKNSAAMAMAGAGHLAAHPPGAKQLCWTNVSPPSQEVPAENKNRQALCGAPAIQGSPYRW
jgi:hypothetical protein